MDSLFKPYKISELKYDVIVVGSGAAGYNAANRLFEFGLKNIAIITEGINIGTSRNAGSDKQTYYKLSLSGEDLDSVDKMAEVIFSGKHMHGDNAKVQAALSVRSFMNLVELGVEFPFNEYGEFIGYKTDHDPNSRGTSAGPYTSKQMTEKLEERAKDYGIEILDKHKVVKIFNSENIFKGVLTINDGQYQLIYASSLVYATGGPASIYKNTAYPLGHKGSTGIALESGVNGSNLTHFQYGLASTKPKWNISGTYMQALPRFFSVDSNGNEHDFLEENYDDFYDMLNNIFLKGYQWPFDVAKIHGSSMIDYLVYKQEVEKHRKVYIDFRQNPSGRDIEFENLGDEAKEYLVKNGANQEKPIDRLIHMNSKAYDFYLDHGVDLKTESLPISLCVQHNNGGLEIDCNFETNVKNFYAVGEVAASHGMYRPGGSALNSGQVGSFMAAKKIAKSKYKSPDRDLLDLANDFVNYFHQTLGDESNIYNLIEYHRTEMTDNAAAFRKTQKLENMIKSRIKLFNNFNKVVKAHDYEIKKVYEFYDLLVGQIVYLEAMADYAEHIDSLIGGSIYYTDEINLIDNGKFLNEIQVTSFNNSNVTTRWEKIRPIPKKADPFEIQWSQYIRDSL